MAAITLLAQRNTMDPCVYSLFPRNLKHLKLFSTTITFRWCLHGQCRRVELCSPKFILNFNQTNLESQVKSVRFLLNEPMK